MYNATWRRLCTAIFCSKNNEYYIFWVRVCCISYVACKSRAPHYIFICGLPGCTVLSTLSYKWHDIRAKISVKCGL